GILGFNSAQIDFQELCAERFHVLSGGGTNIVGFHHGPKATRSSYGLQASHARAQHQYFGRRHRARSGHQQGKHARQPFGSDDHSFITGNGGHGGERVHGLGARGARHQFHGKGREFSGDHRLQGGGFIQWFKKSNDDSAGFQ